MWEIEVRVTDAPVLHPPAGLQEGAGVLEAGELGRSAVRQEDVAAAHASVDDALD